MQHVKDIMLPFESEGCLLKRLFSIKTKLQRMPRLNQNMGHNGWLVAPDWSPGLFHQKDCALLGVLGMLVGVEVVRGTDEFKENL